MMKTIPFLSLLAVWFVVLSCGPTDTAHAQKSESEGTYQLLTPAEFQQKAAEASQPQLLDVRTPKEFAAGTIPGSTNLNVLDSPVFSTGLIQLDPAAPIYVYCKSGIRSKRAVKAMQKAGFQEIYELKGGFLAWKKNGLPIQE